MISIIKTAYPRFKKNYSEEELLKIFHPTDKELRFIRKNAREPTTKLTLLTLLKSHQYLGYLPNISTVPKSLHQYLAYCLSLSKDLELIESTESNKKTFYRYRQAIRIYLSVFAWSDEAASIVGATVKKAALTMSSPPDLVNVAIEKLIERRYELPAFSTLDRMVGHIRHQVHLELYEKLNATLNSKQKQALDKLLQVIGGDTVTDFNKICEKPKKPTLTLMRNWTIRLAWLQQLIDTSQLFEIINPTKVHQFAAEVENAEVQDLLDMNLQKRYTHLVCLIHQRQVSTKDQLADLFLRRIRKTKLSAEKKLVVLQDFFRAIEEQMLGIFSQVVSYTIEVPKDKQLGDLVRTLVESNGGATYLLDQYQQVAAYHNKNFLPLLWKSFKGNRAAVLNLVELLDIRSGTEDDDLVEALGFILSSRDSRKKTIPYETSLDFMTDRWLNYVETKEDGLKVLKRRELEIAVLFFVADGLKCGDLYVSGSEQYADYRKQLLPWSECEKLLEHYCKSVELPNNAADFVALIKKQLTDAAKAADEAYPDNTDFTIDENGEPHLKRQKANPLPEGLRHFEELIKKKMPQRDLIDLLKRVQAWIPYTRHFGPPSGANSKLKDEVYKYIFTIFGYGCNLGANQTVRHTQGALTSRMLRRINKQHIDSKKIDAAIRDIINNYNRWDLTNYWGDGSDMIVDGTHIELIENNMLGSMHIRYGAYGGIAYKYLSDKYIALINRFISCGTWEAIHILDGFQDNKSELQPDTVIGDTQAQSEPVFALSYLMGIQLMPRMRNWNDVNFLRPDESTAYKHIDSLFKKVGDFDKIEKHWKDFMQVTLSIHAGKVIPSMLLRRLGVHSKKNKLYKAFRALGQVIRTIFLLKYITDPSMRRHIQASTTKIESFNSFSDWVTFGGKTLRTGDPVEMEKRIKYADLIANIVMLHNVIDLTDVLNEMNAEGETVTKELVEKISPYLNGHLRRFGRFHLDMDDLPDSLQQKGLDFL
ncbi:MAG: TnpA family transposase [Salibacteraceae bacterium]|jgi:TnpA family transposase